MRFKPDREKVLRVVAGARRVLLPSLIVAGLLTAVSFFFSKALIFFLMRHVHVTLYYFNLSEVFFSSVEIALYTGIFFSVPVIALIVWREFRGELGKRLLHGPLFAASFIFLFYLGSVFCYLVVLPSGITFLLSYQGGPVKAMISTERFVHFCVSMVFAFGAAFELPVLLLVLGKLGVVSYRTLSRTRRYAILIIVIASSVITPTPDIYNMSLLAVPLYVLYEIGILLMRIGERGLTAKHKPV
jgi:sec-independent protein translocase protein TatC